MFNGSNGYVTTTEFPGIYANCVATMLLLVPPVVGSGTNPVVVFVLYKSPGVPVAPVAPVGPGAPVEPVAPVLPTCVYITCWTLTITDGISGLVGSIWLGPLSIIIEVLGELQNNCT